LKIQSSTSKRIGLFGNFSWIGKDDEWIGKDDDFVMQMEPVLRGIESMLSNFKEGISDLIKMVGMIDKEEKDK
jgi:hypothetical protein